MKIAYLINQYPKISHSFIRREIASLEAAGIPVERYSIRPQMDLIDRADRVEIDKTKAVLGIGMLRSILCVLQVALKAPGKFVQALGLTLKTSWGADRSVLHHLAYLMEACVLLLWFEKQKITHVHVHFGTNSTTVAMLCRVLGGPAYSFTVHGPEEFDRGKNISLEPKINNAAFVVAISSFGKSQLFRHCHRQHWSKIHVVHCGVDEEFLNQPPTNIPATPRLVCVGRLCEQKGQLLLVEAAKLLAATGTEFKLILVGDGELRAEIETVIAENNLQNCIEITGWADTNKVRQEILASRVMVLPSFAEGLPVVLMESLALGRPAISTYVAGIPELIEEGVSGWLIPAGSVEAVAKAMKTALEMPVQQLEQMGIAGSQKVLQQHNSATEAAKLAGLFRMQHQGAKTGELTATESELVPTSAL
ncbi:glycosyltransferase [Ancylothrix sp. C2]|uniref:glycosyltransferase n=1 Tax=Ancylothrix sp. D3o TaxID=2953691 RepID=UPI0021BB4573|nr:glycosyltransferase [Ancylothrix sp. D3o]MCT7949707.1 glycosyltransferase [Ancylothrix sp. D3o]